MSTPNPPRPATGATDAEGPVIGPRGTIRVEHLLTGECDGTFRFSLDAESSCGVTVTPEGDITIDWADPACPKGPVLEAELAFKLSSPAGGFLDGFGLGWRGAELPTLEERSLSYRAVAPPQGGSSPLERPIVVALSDNRDTYSYRLHVGYPEDNGSYSIDPKIYNEGDGGPPPRR